MESHELAKILLENPNKQIGIKTWSSETKYDVEVITEGQDGYTFDNVIILKGN